MDTSAIDHMKSALQKVRTDVYPTVEFLIILLPDGNTVRQQASEKLELGKRNYEHIYMISSTEIPKATVEIQDGEGPMNLLQQIIDDLHGRKDVISIEKLGADTYQVKTRQGTFVLRRENQVVVAVRQQSKGVLQLPPSHIDLAKSGSVEKLYRFIGVKDQDGKDQGSADK